jgi:hypothetical protein
MRLFLGNIVAATILAPAGALADEPPVAASTLAAVAAVATEGYTHPAAAEIRSVHKSRARNGLGYCGEVSLEGGSGFTLFHVILAGADGTASVLRLSDYPEGDQSRNAAVARRLLTDFGCIEPETPPPEPDIR